MQRDDYILKLNDPKKKKRLKYAAKLARILEKEDGHRKESACCGFIHSSYSFSPYSPTMAAYMAYNNGLSAAGLVDTGTLAGGAEFLAAAKEFGLHAVVGAGYFTLLPKAYRNLCNVISRDYSRFIYLAAFAVPEDSYPQMDAFLSRYRAERERGNRKALAQINSRFRGLGQLSYEEDVLPVTNAEEGGAITRSHIMLALARRVIRMAGTGDALVDYLTKVQNISLSSREEQMLLSPVGRNYDYDLGRILSQKLKVDDEEYVSQIHKFIGATIAAGGLVFYPVREADAVEGGEKYIDEMIAALKQLKLHGVAYRASAMGQYLGYLERKLKEENLLAIDGNDIHSARDLFYTGPMTALQKEGFYTLVGNAYLAGQDPMDAFYGPRTETRLPEIDDRVRVFSEVGRRTFENDSRG